MTRPDARIKNNAVRGRQTRHETDALGHRFAVYIFLPYTSLLTMNNLQVERSSTPPLWCRKPMTHARTLRIRFQDLRIRMSINGVSVKGLHAQTTQVSQELRQESCFMLNVSCNCVVSKSSLSRSWAWISGSSPSTQPVRTSTFLTRKTFPSLDTAIVHPILPIATQKEALTSCALTASNAGLLSWPLSLPIRQ